MKPETSFDLETVYLDDAHDCLVILDQTLLPNEVKYLYLSTQAEICEAIAGLRVRGAPAIGIAAGYALYLAVKNSTAQIEAVFTAEFNRARHDLAASRPTAINLFWALDKMEACLKALRGSPLPDIIQALKATADQIKDEDLRTNAAIGENALSLLKPGMGLLTHCNAGSLATGKYGTATAAMYLGHQRGYAFQVYVDETRPLLQGARLTAFELAYAGLDVTLICDDMAASVMQAGRVQAVLVGCDRVAANGDTANKIGTCGVAVLARHFGIPFYVCAPTSSIDLHTACGADIPIEQRSPTEVTDLWFTVPMAPKKGVRVFNPAFDVTDAALITAIITEYGILRPPFAPALREVFQRKHAASV